MIVYKQWTKVIEGVLNNEHRHYDGWFLFGFIPLYIRRVA